MRTISLVATGLASVALACGGDDPLSPDKLAGVYPLAQVDGHDPGWYHPLDGVYCDAAFLSGALTIRNDQSFRLELEYDYVCFLDNGYNGHSTLLVTGTDALASDGVLYLDGCGPYVFFEDNCPQWTLEVRPMGQQLTVRFLGVAGLYWADPILTLGPKQ